MSDGAIAIVGASCRFPGAAGLEAYWRLLAGGVDAVSEIGPDRWATRFFHHPRPGEPGKTYSFAAGLIDGADLFEPAFFGISPREAGQMDPQQRLLLELTWHAIEDAGVTAARLAGSGAGVYIGASSTDYGDLRLGDPASGDAYFVAGSTLSILANRISHVFDLRGPSETIDTACSSSLAALHAACAALRGGRIAAAVVGGINLLLSPYPFIGFAQAGMLSRRGRCHAFDARADGYVRAEGGGVVLLKPLVQALRDGDAIRAVIRGTAVGASGRTLGLSLPSEAAQTALLREIYAEAGVAADEVAFFEMHGTGTPAGDPVEAAAVGAAIGQARSAPLPIGSAKTNIGHLEPASGMAGLLKAMLALERNILPASLHGETPNPAIAFDRLNLRLVRAAEPLAAGRYCAGVNSFGFGGSNAHAILARAPDRLPAAAETAPLPLLISARSEAALHALATDWRDRIAMVPPELTPQLARAAARRRDHHPHRLVVLGDDLPAALGGFLAGAPGAAVLSGEALRDGRLAFVYAGNGAQFLGMGQSAYRASAGFRAGVAEADAALAPLLGWPVARRIADGAEAVDFRRADVAQPMLFAIQVAVTLTLRALGARPEGFIGHSVGEIAAAWASGALTLADAARAVAVRSRHQERTRGRGKMAVLALAEAEATGFLAEAADAVEIAAINSSRSVTVAGAAEAIETVARDATERGVACRVLDIDFAFHSAAMTPIRDGLLADLAGLAPAPATGDLISTVTGGRVSGGELDANHWWHNVRDPVRFHDAAASMVAAGYRLFAEIGPRPVLQSYLHDALRLTGVEGRVLSTLDRHETAGDPLPAIAGKLHVAGHDLSGAAMFDGPGDAHGLPLYPWQRQRHWFRRSVEAVARVDPVCDHPLLGFRRNAPLPCWSNHLDTVCFPFLADHRVYGTVVLPAAAIVDMALAAARNRHPGAAALELRDVELLRLMPLPEGQTRETAFNLVSADGDWQLSSRERLAAEAMTLHAAGRIAAARADRLLPAGGSANGERVTPDWLYRQAARLGLDYGPGFRVVSEVAVESGAQPARATVALREAPLDAGADHLIHPVSLDGALHGLLAVLGDSSEMGFLPRRFGRVRAFVPFGRMPRRAELRLTYRGERSAAADIALYDAAGDVVADLADCRLARVERNRSRTPALLRVELVPQPLEPLPAVPAFGRLGEIVDRAVGSPSGAAEEALLFDALVASIVLEAVQKSGGPDRIAAAHRGVLALLQRFGGAVVKDGAWGLVRKTDLPDITALWRSMLAETPEIAPDLAALASLREELPAMLRDGAPLDPAAPAIAALRVASPSVAAAQTAIAAAVDMIAVDWPRARPLRLHHQSAGWAVARLRGFGLAVAEVAAGEPCDLALTTEIGDLSRLGAGLAPGGGLLAPVPLPNALFDLVLPKQSDWRAALGAASFAEAGSATVSLSPWPCAVVWARTPVERAVVSPAARLSLRVPSEGAGVELAAALADAGHRVVTDAAAAQAVIFAVDEIGDAVAHAPSLLPALARAAVAAAACREPLWLVAAGAQQPGDGASPLAAAAWGFARVLQNEIAGLTLNLVDLPPGSSWDERARRIVREFAAADSESEIVWTSLGRHVPRARRGLPPVWAQPDEAIVAAVERPGFDGLIWRRFPARALLAGEVEIDVRAAGLNFRDVMLTAGMLPEEALSEGFAGARPGLECAGIVCAIGPDVTEVALGDRVAGFAPSALASRAVTRADAAIALPPGLDFAAAASLPVAFVTAIYALRRLAQVQPGERVLIHAAAGGVGLAAIQIAKQCGAVVIATAGSAGKRAFLRLAGADHVCDSRELAFVAAIREIAGDSGLDVVLNSLHGEAAEASLDLLQPFGRFVELGKRDIYENRNLRLRSLRRNISYFAVDVDQLPVRRPALAKALLAEMAEALAAGDIRPLAYRKFAFAAIGDAFRLMQAAHHIGKLVLVPEGNSGLPLSSRPEFALRGDASYVVTGGIAGFGFAAARWLAERGAGHVALIGRRGALTPGAASRVAELESLGATVSVHAADVGDEAGLAAALAAIRSGGGAIRGVVHAAAAIVDAMAADLGADQIAAAFHAKLGGALLLDRLTRDDPLDFFWLFSSATALIGAPGQGAYVAANHGLEALARRRRAEGRPASAIAWGPIADAGFLAARPEKGEALARRLGARPMPAETALSALPAIAASGLPVVALAETGWDDTRRALPILATPLFAELRGSLSGGSADEGLLDELAGLDDEARRRRLADIVADESARILRLGGPIDRQRPLPELGMDSLMAVELRLAIEARLGIDLPLMSLAESASVAALAARLAAAMTKPSTPEPVADLAMRYEAPLDPFALGGAGSAPEG